MIDVQNALDDLIDKLNRWVQGFILHLPNLIVAVLVFLLFWLTAKLVRRLCHRFLPRVIRSEQVSDLLAVTLFIVILATGVFVAMGILGLSKTVTSLLAGAGIIGLAAGLAFQAMGENFIAGVYLSVRRPFHRGQIIKSNDYFGTVEKMGLRATWLRVPEGQLVFVPNKSVFSNAIVNYSDRNRRRVDLESRVSHREDLAKVKEVATAAVTAIEERDKTRAVQFYYDGFGESSIDFEIRFWIMFKTQPDYLAARSEAVMRIKKAFDENGITIPFPIRTLDFAPVGGETLTETLTATNLARPKT